MNQEKENCQHKFVLSQVTTEQTNHGSGSTGFFYKRIAYVICEKCGEVLKQDL